jgi:hypothetical protein
MGRPRDRPTADVGAAFSRSCAVRALTVLGGGAGRSESRMATVPNSPMTPTAVPVQRHDITAIRQAVIEGNAIFPRSPAKL